MSERPKRRAAVKAAEALSASGSAEQPETPSSKRGTKRSASQPVKEPESISDGPPSKKAKKEPSIPKKKSTSTTPPSQDAQSDDTASEERFFLIKAEPESRVENAVDVKVCFRIPNLSTSFN
ncbi:hypothetical protein HDV00_011935 [Rhizophlyctis rosea]|nr:hypothetical protein HDV00_011935 [Rhizophlyctis rosea]